MDAKTVLNRRAEMNPFEYIVYWHWWSVAAALLLLEVLTPNAYFFLGLGVSAGLLGLLLVFKPLSFGFQLLLFALLSTISITLWRSYWKPPMD